MLVMIKALYCYTMLKKILKENKVTKQIISLQTLDATIVELEYKAWTAMTIPIIRNITAAMIRIYGKSKRLKVTIRTISINLSPLACLNRLSPSKKK